MIAFESTEPVILAFARLTGSSVDEEDHGPSVCVDPNELVRFMRIHSRGTGISVFDFSRLVHELANNLLHAMLLSAGDERRRYRGLVAAVRCAFSVVYSLLPIQCRTCWNPRISKQTSTPFRNRQRLISLGT